VNQDLFILPDRLRELFHPRSIALVGATDASRWSVSTFENLKHFGFAGPSTASIPIVRLYTVSEP